MKKLVIQKITLLKILFISLILLSFTSKIFAQLVMDRETVESTAPPGTYYISGSTEDKQFLEITSMSVRKVSTFVSTLEVLITVESHVTPLQNARLVLIAYLENDLTNSHFRKYVPQMPTRERDFEKEIRKIGFLESTPKIKKKDVFLFSKKNPLRKYSNQYLLSLANLENLKETDYPSVLDYLQYIQSNIKTLGIPFNVWSFQDNRKSKELDYMKHKNNCDFIYAEAKTMIFCSFKTNILYQGNFFTHLVAFLYSENQQKVIYRKTIEIATEIAIQNENKTR